MARNLPILSLDIPASVGKKALLLTQGPLGAPHLNLSIYGLDCKATTESSLGIRSFYSVDFSRVLIPVFPPGAKSMRFSLAEAHAAAVIGR